MDSNHCPANTTVIAIYLLYPSYQAKKVKKDVVSIVMFGVTADKELECVSPKSPPIKGTLGKTQLKNKPLELKRKKKTIKASKVVQLYLHYT